MTAWKITYRNANGEKQVEHCINKKIMIFNYINKMFMSSKAATGIADKKYSISELKAWKNGREYTDTLNRFLEK